MRHATELKTRQPIFPGQPPPLARVESSKQQNYSSPQPPPRQSSQPPQRSSNVNRTAFPGQQPPNVAVSSPSNSFREPSFSAAAVAQQQVNISVIFSNYLIS